jgi:DNA-binding transcriptional MocR family regulator
MLLGAIQKYLVPLGATVPSASENVTGGYFIWVALPSPLLAADIVQRAQEEENLRLAPGTLFEVGSPQPPSDRFAGYLRLWFALVFPRHLSQGVGRVERGQKQALV